MKTTESTDNEPRRALGAASASSNLRQRSLYKKFLCRVLIVIGCILSMDFVEFHISLSSSIDDVEHGGTKFEYAWQTLRSQVEAEAEAAAANRSAIYLGHQHHIIMVPYRDRPLQRQLFLETMTPYLQRNYGSNNTASHNMTQSPLLRHTFSIWIVEQDNNDIFNKGWLIDVGLAEVIRAALPGTSCIIEHDVDFVPDVDGVPYHRCQPLPVHLGSELESFKWRTPYSRFFGGVISLHIEHWKQINGFSLAYRGWGAEDDDAFNRIRKCGLSKTPGKPDRPPRGLGRFRNLDHRSPDPIVSRRVQWRYIFNFLRFVVKSADPRCKTKDGLSSVRYRLTDVQVENFDFANASIPVVSLRATEPTRRPTMLPLKLFDYSHRIPSTRGARNDSTDRQEAP